MNHIYFYWCSIYRKSVFHIIMINRCATRRSIKMINYLMLFCVFCSFTFLDIPFLICDHNVFKSYSIRKMLVSSREKKNPKQCQDEVFILQNVNAFVCGQIESVQSSVCGCLSRNKMQQRYLHTNILTNTHTVSLTSAKLLILKK